MISSSTAAWRRHERPAALDARLVRAHAAGRDADAERRARVARRQRRSASPRRDRRSHPRAGVRSRATVERLVRELAARRRRPVGDDVPARAPRCKIVALVRALEPRRAHRRRRLRSEPRAGGLRRIRDWASTSSCAAKASITFRELLRALEARRRRSRHRRPVVPARRTAFSPQSRPRRQRAGRRATSRCRTARARVLAGYTLLGRPVDVVETSRGCTYDCSFCSIIEMRGRNFHTYSIERVLADIADARAPRRARRSSSSTTTSRSNVARFEALCQAIVDAGLQRHRLHRAGDDRRRSRSTATTLAPLMRRAGFRYVFLGIENVLDDDLAFLKARGEERAPRAAAARSATRRSTAIDAPAPRTACSSSAA